MPRYEITTRQMTTSLNAHHFAVESGILYLLNNRDALIAAFSDWQSIVKE